MTDALATEVLVFWFGSPRLSDEVAYREAWFKRDEAFDAAIAAGFSTATEAAIAGGLDSMAVDAEGALALTILLDQFPRNLFRGGPRAFAGDERARRIAGFALQRGLDRAMSRYHRMFLYLPYEHSESLADQERSVELFATIGDERAYDYAVRHRDVIARFGRFPHRNAMIGRDSTAEEIEFLKTPGSSF